MTTGVTRRSALRGAAVTAIGVVSGFLVARRSAAARESEPGAQANAYGPPAPSRLQRIATITEIPRGGGIILNNPPIVLARGGSGAIRAFSAICTHQGCTVSHITNDVIVCPCHGSSFSLATGRVIRGPATQPLPRVRVTVRNGTIYQAPKS